MTIATLEIIFQIGGGIVGAICGIWLVEIVYKKFLSRGD